MASSNSIHLTSQISKKDVESNVTFNPLATNKYGGKFSKVLYNGQWFYNQWPRMKSPFGFSKYEAKDGRGNTSYSVDLAFDGYKDKGTKTHLAYEYINNMQNHLVKNAVKNNFTWIGDADATEPVCKALLRPNIRFSKDKKTGKVNDQYPPTMKFALKVYDGELKTKVFLNNKDNQITDIDELLRLVPGRFEAVLIVKCDKVTFNGGKYGFKWLIEQMKVYVQKNTMGSYAFVDDGDETRDEEYTRSESAPQSSSPSEPSKPDNFVESSSESESEDDDLDNSDSESDEESEEQVKVSPKKVVRKKRIIRRKKNNS